MSKAELLEEISKLPPEERGEIWDALWTLEERHLLGSSGPSDYEKAVLDREMEDFEKNPWVGASWEEVEARLCRHLSPTQT
jgi:putative addiction module component (TIGR02574 family)